MLQIPFIPICHPIMQVITPLAVIIKDAYIMYSEMLIMPK